jgi:hypothetical protein
VWGGGLAESRVSTEWPPVLVSAARLSHLLRAPKNSVGAGIGCRALNPHSAVILKLIIRNKPDQLRPKQLELIKFLLGVLGPFQF